MENIYNTIMNNIYLYVCILLGLSILITILIIVIGNEKNRTKIKRDFVEAEKAEEELEKIEESPVTNELEDILNKMQQDMDVAPEDVVRKFEEEQEENAIISYQELVDNVKSGKIEVVDDEESEIDFVEKLELSDNNLFVETSVPADKESVTPEMLKDAIESISRESIKQPVEPVRQFKKSEIISPVYGIMDSNFNYTSTNNSRKTAMDLMNTKDYNELTEEIKKQEEFLKALIEFRNNL